MDGMIIYWIHKYMDMYVYIGYINMYILDT